MPSLPNPSTRRGWSHHRGLRPLRILFSNSGVGSFTSHLNRLKGLWDGTYGFSSLSEKSTKSNHLQISLQRKYFLLNYLKTLRVGPPGFEPATSRSHRPALSKMFRYINSSFYQNVLSLIFPRLHNITKYDTKTMIRCSLEPAFFFIAGDKRSPQC